MGKRLEHMRRNPRGDWSIADVRAVCDEAGVQCIPPRSGGSHYKVYHSAMTDILTVPFKRPIKAVYLRKLVAFIDEAKRHDGQT
ncbi:MAG: type II toxin-antitoxin system HicA family toxin [Mesorhizobium sp.]|nr:MAG: type II toxin-antitoxin system HicA family toxin [Mesorhizobium sp.]TKB52051.1 MAG: type II toxin-antitoxin system HicA family toxin [Mesorhizobium sp.]